MKFIIIMLIICLLSFNCNSQTKVSETKVEPEVELKPPFSNQGEQEDYWTQELFRNEYKAKNYSKYFGEIKSENENLILFEKGQSINLSDTDSRYITIFTNGLFYLDLLNAMRLNISGLKELEFLSDSPKVKRFRFWLFRPGIANPTVYVFELRNDQATGNLDWEEYLKGARLTFLKEGWIVIYKNVAQQFIKTMLSLCFYGNHYPPLENYFKIKLAHRRKGFNSIGKTMAGFGIFMSFIFGLLLIPGKFSLYENLSQDLPAFLFYTFIASLFLYILGLIMSSLRHYEKAKLRVSQENIRIETKNELLTFDYKNIIEIVESRRNLHIVNFILQTTDRKNYEFRAERELFESLENSINKKEKNVG